MEIPKLEEQLSLAERESDCCDVTVIHEDAVAQIRQVRLQDDVAAELASIFQALGDPTRVRIIHALIRAEMCVCELAAALDMTQSAVSHQLRYLRNLRIVKRRKAGRTVYYSIDDEHVLTLFKMGLDHVSHR